MIHTGWLINWNIGIEQHKTAIIFASIGFGDAGAPAAFFRVTADTATHHAYKPSIGLLNVGEEEQKGSASIRDAAAILSDPEINMNYYGFVEGSDFPMGGVDIVVSDGFSGNVALKTAEGTSRLIGTIDRKSVV